MHSRRLSSLLAAASALAGCGEDLPPLPRIEGPPCPVSNVAAFLEEGGRMKSHTFNDLTYSRRSGHGSCRAHQGASVCHLSAPNLLRVSAKGRDWWFAPGRGERVVLVVGDGPPRCVLDRASSTEDWSREHLTPACRDTAIRRCG